MGGDFGVVERYSALAEVIRSGFVESRHFGLVAGLSPDGELAVAEGDLTQTVLPRSAAKPLQAVACLTAGAPLVGARLALATGSHSGEDGHVAAVDEILRAAGLSRAALGCPPAWPADADTRDRLARAGAGPARERMNCSGKHAAMLAACVAAGWPVDGYRHPDHPLQRHVRATVERLTGEEAAHVAVDGCGAPIFGFTLPSLARAMQALALSAPGTPEHAVADAMREHPWYVGGTNHPNTKLMRAVSGLFCKGGAEGVLVAATGEGHTVATKIIDGSGRATTAVTVATLARLGAEMTGAEPFLTRPVLGGGVPVGEIRVVTTHNGSKQVRGAH